MAFKASQNFAKDSSCFNSSKRNALCHGSPLPKALHSPATNSECRRVIFNQSGWAKAFILPVSSAATLKSFVCLVFHFLFFNSYLVLAFQAEQEKCHCLTVFAVSYLEFFSI